MLLVFHLLFIIVINFMIEWWNIMKYNDWINDNWIRLNSHQLLILVFFLIYFKLPSFDYYNPFGDLLELRQLEAGERYARSHGPFGCTPRPSSEVSRTSLLGRPLKTGYRTRDPRYRRTQTRVYNFLERPRGCRAVFYHILL